MRAVASVPELETLPPCPIPRPAREGTWTEVALRVLRERYLQPLQAAPGPDGTLPSETQETPEDMCWRVALAIAAAERTYGKTDAEVRAIAEHFYDVMVAREFLPNSPTLMNAGKGNGLQLSACFVLPIEDSMAGIFEAVKRAALIHQSGGGTGMAFSRLRPKDSLVKSTHGKASGPVSFLRVFNAATDVIKQGGTRRGANMAILRVDHPDILEFIDCKGDGGLTNFNISVGITDAFMEALDADRTYDLVAPHTQQVTGSLRAREVFTRIVRNAWGSGDPGLVFLDRINRSPANPTPTLDTIESTNPCGESPLPPNDACNLGSINLGRFAVLPTDAGEGTGQGAPAIAWDRLEAAVRTAVRFLDDVIDVNPFPLPEITAQVRRTRRIGLGVMGWADLLTLLGIPYDSEAALELADRLMGFIRRTGHDESARLALERGPFAEFSQSIYREGPPLRNGTVTTIAPTGTISIIAGCSSGIEPLFALAYRHIVEERHLTFMNPVFEAALTTHGLATPGLLARVAAQGTLKDIPEIPEDLRRVFVTAHEIRPSWHIRMQAAFQKHTDNGVSKTINLPHSASEQDVADAYRLAWESGCLGITVFRDGCKPEQVLNVGTTAPAKAPTLTPRPRRVSGETYRSETPLGTAFVTINHTDGRNPLEAFVAVGKAGSDTASVSEAIGRLVSLCLRLPCAIPTRDRLQQVIDQLAGIGGPNPLGFGPDRVRSLPDALAQIFTEYLNPETEPPASGPQLALPQLNGNGKGPRIADLCPMCGAATFVYEEGCAKCHSCGHAQC